MKCPKCSRQRSRVVDSRRNEDFTAIRRRRVCLHCNERFTTYERLLMEVLMVVKQDGSRQPYDREKLIHSILKSCAKRPVSTADIEKIVDSLERRDDIQLRREISTKEIGDRVLAKLKDLDSVAYIRFASVYQRFNDVEAFIDALAAIRKEKDS